MINWSQYLESLCKAYKQWWQIYTITDVVGQKPIEAEPSPFLFDFGLMVQTVEPDRGETGKGEEKVERLTVLEGLRKYASEHVLLVGRPGSGKSTALARLVLEEAGKARTPLNPPLARGEEDCSTDSFTSNAQESLAPPLIRGAGGVKIPALVELRYYRTSILDLIQDFLQRHDPNLTVDAETLKTWLRQGQLLLLVDGVNELPSEEARRDLHKLRQDYQKTTPMIFTTRDLGVGGDLDIAKKLEMQPLSEAQMQQFVRAYLPEQGEQMLRQLGSRLREFGQTPLLLWMLCSLFRAMGKVPPNLGKVFRQFALSYEGKLKQDIPISKESRRWWHRLLEHLAWVMTSGEATTQLQVTISRQKAEAVLTEFLVGKVAHPDDCGLCWLEDLLNHHLIQVGANNQIEFRHQLIQEYYTAEYLLKVLTPPTPLNIARDSDYSSPLSKGGVRGVNDDELKLEYLNYLKWTEPLALMLELMEDEAQTVRVVKLALEVDWWLGARLAGAVKPEWQEQTVSLVAQLEIPQLLKIQLLGLTKSERVIPHLVKALANKDFSVRNKAVVALGKIGSEATVTILIQALTNVNYSVRRSAADALGIIGSETAITALGQALEHQDYDVRWRATLALGKIGEAAIPTLHQALEHEDDDVRRRASNVLGIISSGMASSALRDYPRIETFNRGKETADVAGEISPETPIPTLIKNLVEHRSPSVRVSAARILGEIKAEAAIPPLIKALKDKDYDVRENAAKALGNIGSAEALPSLISVLRTSSPYGSMYNEGAIEAIAKIGSDAAIPTLVRILKDDDAPRPALLKATEALGQIGSDAAVTALSSAIFAREEGSTAATALAKIGSEKAISSLIYALQDEGLRGHTNAVEALSKIGLHKEAVISALIHALEHENHDVRNGVTKVLYRAKSKKVISHLIHLLNHKDSDVCRRAAVILSKIGSEEAIFGLKNALKCQKDNIHSRTTVDLGTIVSEAVMPNLIDESKLGNYKTVKALSMLDSEAAISALIDALENNNSYSARKNASNALCDIGSAAIPSLIIALKNEGFVVANQGDTFDKATQSLKAIQERCKFYNCTLTQLHIPPRQPISTSLMYILHLSDIHFGTPDQANLWSNQLAVDLQNDLSIPHLHALILSGDIANYSTEEEYQAAEQFLHNLRQDFPLNPEQIILVPGNHDLNWKLAKKAYKLTDRDEYDGELIDGHYIEESASVIRVRDEAQYKQRFAHFSQFYETIKQNPYPLDYDQQYTLDHLKEQNLLILGLNSAWQLDHHYKSRASINTNALSNALTQIRRNPDYKNCLKIAVWHHPLDSAYSDRITDQGFLEQLAVNGFRFFLHGHIHKAETSLYRYDMSTNGRKLDRICAGTFGAPVREWVPGYPLQYNLLKIEDNQLTVYTRRREELNGAWKPDARWLQGAGKTPLDYYEISLS